MGHIKGSELLVNEQSELRDLFTAFFCITSFSMKSFSLSFLAIFLAACASQGHTGPSAATSSAIEQTGDGLANAALSPLEDLNLKREPIPPVLAGLATTYGLPEPVTCSAIANEVTRPLGILLASGVLAVSGGWLGWSPKAMLRSLSSMRPSMRAPVGSAAVENWAPLRSVKS
jgi:hypothetical protein